MTANGRVALVTGAGRGLGEAIAQLLAGQGISVAVNDLHEERARTVRDAITAAGGKAAVVAVDASDREAVSNGVSTIEADLGPIDILVNNAGIPEGRWSGPFRESTPEQWAPYIDLNIYGSLYCMRATLPGMCDRGWGRIVQISSGVGSRGLPAGSGEALYGASKAAIDGFIRHLALEVAHDGVTVNAIAPGLMPTALEHATPDVLGPILAAIPLGRMGQPREVAAAVSWLVSDDGAFATGQVIHVNGGAFQGR